MQTTPKPGDVVGPFALDRLLGQGGMGAVFVARHMSGVEVALKVLIDPTPAILERFKRELAAMARVDRHPNCVRVHSAGTYGPEARPYVVMELVKGADLAKAIDGRPMEPGRAAAIVEKVARAVAHCHEQGVIHRDLKPANVLIRAEDQEPLVTDFGLARDDSAERLTKTGELLGTPAYMAPEQLGSERDAVDARCDVYALGAILYECLTGEQPFESDSQASLLKKVLLDDPVDPRRKVPAVPRDLSVIALKCLAKEPERRYRTASGLADELVRFMKGEPILARPETRGERFERKLRRNKAFVVLGALLVAALVAAVVVVPRALRDRFPQALEAALAVAEKNGFPELPDQPVAGAEPVFAALRASMRSTAAAVGTALVLDRWERLAREPRATLATPAPPGDLAAALDAVAAARSANADLAEGVLSRLAGPPRDMLAAHRAALAARTGTLPALLAAFRSLAPDAQRAWGSLLEDDLARALPAHCTEQAPVAGALDAFVAERRSARLAPLLRDAADADRWRALGLRAADPAAAVALARRIELDADRRKALGAGLAERARPKIDRLASRKEREEAYRLIGLVGELGAPLLNDVALRLAALAGDYESAAIADRIECLEALVQNGIMPDVDFAIQTSVVRLNEKERVERDLLLGRSLLEFVGTRRGDVLAAFLAGVAIIDAALDIEAVDRHRRTRGDPELPGKPWERLLRDGRDLLARTPPLTGRAAELAHFERGRLLLEAGLLQRPDVDAAHAGDDPEQLRLARAELEAATKYARPCARMKSLLQIDVRLLKRLAAEAEHEGPAGLARLAAAAEETLASASAHAAAWGAEAKEVAEYLERFATAEPTNAEDQRRLTELSNIYGLQFTVAMLTDPLSENAAAHNLVAAVYAFRGDPTREAQHREAAVKLLDRAIAIAPERPNLFVERAAGLEALGRHAEAKKDLETALKTDSMSGGLDPKERRHAEETLKKLK